MTTPRSICDDHSRFVKGCDGCRTATATRKRHLNRMVAYGRPVGCVPADAAREHVEALLAAGMTRSAIGRAAQVARNVINLVAAGTQRTVSVDTERKILAVQLAAVAPTSVSSLGAQRRLQALMAAGWSAESLAPLLGTSAGQVLRWRWRLRPTMSAAAHEVIAHVYRQIGDRPGPSEVARGQGRALGYPLPIHWDDDGDLDSPNDRPKQFLKTSTTVQDQSKEAA